MTEKTETYEVVSEQTVKANISGNLTSLTVEELYDKDKFDLSTMEPTDIFELLQYVSPFFFFFFFFFFSLDS
jgi:H+-transporting ATPase